MVDVSFSSGSSHLPYVEAHKAGDEAALLQSVGQAHHAGEGKLSKHWISHANRMTSLRWSPLLMKVCGELCFGRTIKQGVQLCLVFHSEKQKKKDTSQDDHSHSQDRKRSEESHNSIAFKQ